MPLLLQQMQSRTSLEKLSLLYAMSFRQTSDTLEVLFDYLHNPAISINTNYHLQMLIYNSDLSILEPFRPKFNLLFEPFQQTIEFRQHLVTASTSDLWDALQEICRKAQGKYVNEMPYSQGLLITMELGKRQDLDPDAVMGILNRRSGGYELAYVTLLAGERKLEEAIPPLIEFLGEEGDLLSGNAVKALVRIGSVKAVEEIAIRFPQADWLFRFFACEVLAHLKFSESESALMAFLPAEVNPTISTRLADGLCSLLSADGIPLIQRQIEQGYDRKHLSLEEALIINCTMNQIDLPELDSYRHDIEVKEQRLIARQQEVENWAKASEAQGASTAGSTGGKLGRNEPCSCGSGKKYKKCCGA
ncbi:HEAT repeat domain-containing protein [Paenibacillus koleovorans]|uniref:HEAT repeat domain-containing protein n=1 Tax=Paenibacillus koleovorans TaxID=121608 RepID=UPI0013E2C70B|nr:HEAT repeat domain-containing protein [Paenibacillus koleovorans]